MQLACECVDDSDVSALRRAGGASMSMDPNTSSFCRLDLVCSVVFGRSSTYLFFAITLFIKNVSCQLIWAHSGRETRSIFRYEILIYKQQ